MSVVGLCDKCTKGGRLAGEPAGTMTSQGAYIARNPATDSETSTSPSKKCLVLLTDVFGLPLNNCKLIADQMAKRAGCDVWIPDMFNGSPIIKPDSLDGVVPVKPGQKIGFFGYIRFVGLLLTRFPYLLMNRASVIDARNHKFLAGLRKEGYSKIGAFGYCLGGAAATRLAGTKDIDSAVVIHPGRVSKKQIEAIRVPTAFACAEDDFTFPLKYAHECEALLAARNGTDAVEYEFHEYKGVVHGFATRPHLENPADKGAFEECFEQTAKWFEKTL